MINWAGRRTRGRQALIGAPKNLPTIAGDEVDRHQHAADVRDLYFRSFAYGSGAVALEDGAEREAPRTKLSPSPQ